ncbi:MAG: ribonuclease III [Acetobacteraceae bacterium]|nr:ribonuclease III [Acetobacteraceae bacterium]
MKPEEGARLLAGRLARICRLRPRRLDLLAQALTHSSLSPGPGQPGPVSNERLEFLGDAALGLAVALHLFEREPAMSEGSLTRARSSVVCQAALSQGALRLGLGDCLALGKGEEGSGGRTRPSVLSGALEAVAGALLLEGGMAWVRRLAAAALGPELESAAHGGVAPDYKTELQALVQQGGQGPPAYVLESEEGPDHQKQFQVAVLVGDTVLGRGGGRSKREAEQEAAREALARLGRPAEPEA